MSLLENLLSTILNDVLGKGLSLNWIIKDVLKLDFIDLYYFNLRTEDEYI